MAHIPQAVLDQMRTLPGLTIRNDGKVRRSYNLPGRPHLMLPYVTDRISIRDFVLPFTVPQKGEILNALSIFLTTEIIQSICETDLVTFGNAMDEYVPNELKGDVDYQKRSTVVKLLTPANIEAIARIGLTGSGYKEYEKTGMVNVHRLPPGLRDGDLLPFPIFDPTTKADVGHDKRISADEVARTHGHKVERLTLQLAQAIYTYGLTRGALFFDTKFEWSVDENGILVLTDEKGTCDSSRWALLKAWQKAMDDGTPVTWLDKEYVRKVLDPLVKGLDPENPADLAKVDALVIPNVDLVASTTTRRYRYLFWLTTGKMLEKFQREDMGIKVDLPRRKIKVIVGSENDMSQIDASLVLFDGCAEGDVDVISCHRNPEVLRNGAKTGFGGADVVVTCAGKLAALAGDTKALLCENKFEHIPVIGVGLEGDSHDADQAAILSMEQLPGQPVELDADGHAYFGPVGVSDAFVAAMEHEFLTKSYTPKPAKLGIRKFS